MRKTTAVLCLGALAAVLLAGCGSRLDVKKNTVALQKNGKVLEAAVEDFDQSYYDEDELNSFVEDAVKEYTSENGKKTVTVTDFKLKDETAYLTLKYESTDVFSDFTGTECFSGDLLEAQSAGYDFDADFWAVEDGKAAKDTVSSSEVLADDDLKVLIINGNSDIIVPGKIAYVSANGTEVSAKDTVTVQPKEDDPDESILVYVLYK